MCRTTILIACLVASLAQSCATSRAEVGDKDDDDATSDTDTDADTDGDTDSDGDTDTDSDECPYDCMTAALCEVAGGTIHDGYTCEEPDEVCCEWASDTDTDADTDTDTDSDTDTDTDSDTGTGTNCDLSELETFDSSIPAGWTVVDGGTSAGAWEWIGDLPSDYPAGFPVDGGAFIDSHAAGEGSLQDDDLESPLYDLADCSSATLSYDYNFQKDDFGTDAGEVYVVPGGTETPVLLVSYTVDSPADVLLSETIPIGTSEIGDETTFKVVFHYEGADDLGWYVDNVAVEGVP